MTGAEAFVRALGAHDVSHIFGLCGDTSLPLYDALARQGDGITHVLARDERSAAYMADGYARVTGRVGVCEGPSGGGATYLLPGVVEANESSVPLLAITTDVGISARNRYTLTELDQERLYAPLTKWNTTLLRADAIGRTVRIALAQATGGRPGAVHLSFPFDVQREACEAADGWPDPRLARAPSRRVAPNADDVAHAARALVAANRPVFICGGGVVSSGAQRALVELAELLDAAVATTISGRGSIADAHPLAVGVVGSNGGTPETRAIVDAADLVVFIACRAGSVTTERWRHPVPERVPVIAIDVDPATVATNYPTVATVVGDARESLHALRRACERLRAARSNAESGIRAEIVRQRALKLAAFEALAASNERPIRPERVIAELAAVAPADALVVADPGTPCPYFSAYYPQTTAERTFISNRAHGALGYSLPAAIGAWFGRPNARPIAAMGDGSFGFVCGELETAVRYQIPLVCLVFSNAEFGWIKAGQKHGFGARYYSVDFGRTDHAAVARAFGCAAWRVEDPRELRSALVAAFAQDRPALVDIVVQPLEEARAPVSEWIA